MSRRGRIARAIALAGEHGHCCVPNGKPCGTAGTGTECCSRVCGNDGICGNPPPPVGNTCSGTGNNDGGPIDNRVWNCINEPTLGTCDCIKVTPPRTNLATCPSGFDCCVRDSSDYCVCHTLSGGTTCEGIRASQTYQPATIVSACPL